MPGGITTGLDGCLSHLVPFVVQRRCGVPEVVHIGAIRISDANGSGFELGSGQLTTPLRSTAKPFILISLLETILSTEIFSAEELAIMMSSHNGEPRHVAVVKRLLAKYDLPEDVLHCGVHEAFAPNSDLSPIGNQCSGKHALFLVACRVAGWPLDTYWHVDNELQTIIRSRLQELLCADQLLPGVDGCSIPTYAITLEALARAYARLATDLCGELGVSVRKTMQDHAFYIAGTDCLDTYLNSKYGLLAKSGSDGVWAIGVPTHGLGLAAKAITGDESAAQAALLECLDRLNIVSIETDVTLKTFHKRTAYSLVGVPVGEIEACLPGFPTR